MSRAEHIVPEYAAQEKLLAALCALFTLKAVYLTTIIGAFAVVVLFVLVVILDALIEICGHVSQMWAASSSIEKLLIFIVAWLFFWKISPVVARVIRHCRKVL